MLSSGGQEGLSWHLMQWRSEQSEALGWGCISSGTPRWFSLRLPRPVCLTRKRQGTWTSDSIIAVTGEGLGKRILLPAMQWRCRNKHSFTQLLFAGLPRPSSRSICKGRGYGTEQSHHLYIMLISHIIKIFACVYKCILSCSELSFYVLIKALIFPRAKGFYLRVGIWDTFSHSLPAFTQEPFEIYVSDVGIRYTSRISPLPFLKKRFTYLF